MRSFTKICMIAPLLLFAIFSFPAKPALADPPSGISYPDPGTVVVTLPDGQFAQGKINREDHSIFFTLPDGRTKREPYDPETGTGTITLPNGLSRNLSVPPDEKPTEGSPDESSQPEDSAAPLPPSGPEISLPLPDGAEAKGIVDEQNHSVFFTLPNGQTKTESFNPKTGLGKITLPTGLWANFQLPGYEKKEPETDDSDSGATFTPSESDRDYTPPESDHQWKPPVSDGDFKPPTIDHSWKPPVSDEDFKPPAIDHSWKPPVSDGDFKPPAIDHSWKAPQSDNGWAAPQSDNGWAPPQSGNGWTPAGTDNNWAAPESDANASQDSNGATDNGWVVPSKPGNGWHAPKK